MMSSNGSDTSEDQDSTKPDAKKDTEEAFEEGDTEERDIGTFIMIK